MYPQAHVLTRYFRTALPHWSIVGVWSTAGVMLAALIGATSSATAQSRASAPGASNSCAIYGSGFVAIQGTGSCVRIGGRLRVEGSSTFGGSNFNRGSAAGFAGADAGDGPARAHLRLEGPLGGQR